MAETSNKIDQMVIGCECGALLPKNYIQASRIVEPDGKIYWVWFCSACGQGWKEALKPIKEI
jgi:hypothetical protein